MTASKPEPLIVERTFNATPAQVWKAITDPEAMRIWYFDVPNFKAQIGFEFQFNVHYNGTDYRHLCKVTAAVPEKKLAYTWRYADKPGDSLVTFEIIAEGASKTRLKLTHEGLETFPAEPSYRRENFEGGWNDLIGRSLPDFLATADRQIVITRDYDAPIDLVWKAMTDPAHLVHWWGPNGFTTTVEKMDFRVGGEWLLTMVGPDGTKYPNKSIFREIVEKERVVFDHGDGSKEHDTNMFVATWSFEARSATRTRLTARMVFPTAEQRDKIARDYGAVEGGQQTLAKLAAHLKHMK